METWNTALSEIFNEKGILLSVAQMLAHNKKGVQEVHESIWIVDLYPYIQRVDKGTDYIYNWLCCKIPVIFLYLETYNYSILLE